MFRVGGRFTRELAKPGQFTGRERRGEMGMGKVRRGGARGRAEEKENIEERNVSLILTKISGSL